MTLLVCDSHVHFWDPQQFRFQWLDDFDVLNKPYLPEHVPHTGSAGSQAWQIEKIVFIQADTAPEQSADEASWVTALAEKDHRIKAVVAFVPLEQGGDVRGMLEQYQANPLVKGIRRLIQSEARGFATQSNFVEGVRLLTDFGYTFDICVKHDQLPDVNDLVRQCPDVRFVLDHAGKPDIRGGGLETWKGFINILAGYPNVMCKLSGLVTEANPQSWKAIDLKPYVHHVLETFGVNRVMYGSDSPVLNVVTDYDTWMTTVYGLVVDELSEDERVKLFYTNATRFYGI
jgi:L-fuconolactonase